MQARAETLDTENRSFGSIGHQPRVASVILAAASAGAIVLMAHHPTIQAKAMADAITEIADKAALDKGVHGTLIALLGAMVFAFAELSTALGWRRASVRAAFMAYVLGSASMIGAALISGFLIPSLSAHFAARGTGDVEALRGLMLLSALGNRTLANFGVAGMALGASLWSVALLSTSTAGKAIGALGLLVSAGSAAALLTGVVELDVGGMTLIVVVQAVWNLAVAWFMWRSGGRPLPAPRDPLNA